MNCQEFWNGEPHALDHLKVCRDCAIRWERQQQLVVGLRALGAQMRRMEAPPRVERRLMAGFRGQSEFEGMPGRAAGWAIGTWAAAVAATLALAVVLVRGHQPERIHPAARNLTQLAAVEYLENAGELADVEGFGGEFIALPNTEGIAPNEAVNLVRVEVPRSAMIPLGFTVSEERASERVEADVMLGADGVARAVRFLDRE